MLDVGHYKNGCCMAKGIKSAITTNATRTTNNVPPLPLRTALSLLVLRVMRLRLRPMALHLEKCLYVRASCAFFCFSLLLLVVRANAVLVALYPRGRCCFLFQFVCFICLVVIGPSLTETSPWPSVCFFSQKFNFLSH